MDTTTTPRRRGRPSLGRTARLGTVRVQPDLREAIEAARREGEAMSDAVIRLLVAGLRAEEPALVGVLDFL